MPVNRRSVLTSALLAVTARFLPLPYWIEPALAEGAAEKKWRHGSSLYGELKYPAGFKQFEYVNAKAPKGGVARQIALGTFDNFNSVIAGVKGSIAAGIDLIHETLAVPSLDEVSSEYGLLAEAMSYPDDYASVSYRLRSEAKWQDGTPVTPDDVIFSFDAWKKNSPQQSAYYRHVSKVEKTGEREVTFTFDGPGNHELPQIIGQLTVLCKAWWTGTDKNGKQRDVTATTLEPPLGSGPYRIKDFTPGRNITLERVKDYWGANLNVGVGVNNFDELHFEYFRDTTVALEAFKANTVDWRTENSAKNWATAYDFPAVSDKRVLLEEFPIRNVGMMQAFAFNIRRAKFSDPRVRLAFNYAFNFEEMNKQIFYGQYKRIASFFEGTDLAATGVPTGKELELLETVRDKIPPEVFKRPYSNPVNATPEDIRNNLRDAVRLFNEAGYEVRDQKMVNKKTGEPFSLEFLAEDPTFERVFLFYKPSLDRLGIDVSVRTVDEAQFENRVRSWDFDIITMAWGESLSPGNEQRGYWGSQSADQAGSLNIVGIKNPAVDAMIDQIVFSKNRADLEAATHALDRILLWNFYVVPQWTYGKVRTARWDRFSHPETMPKYGRAAFPTVWWWDAEKAAKFG
ncbi:MAG TPA: extracellular solute-binding protein [Xanthobacteraceae bacterium]|jgi:microcin C transport system substrate-binding protein|nr:extracellular solute-binding protein [Xanthobacteraceae bacterium]